MREKSVFQDMSTFFGLWFSSDLKSDTSVRVVVNPWVIYTQLNYHFPIVFLGGVPQDILYGPVSSKGVEWNPTTITTISMTTTTLLCLQHLNDLVLNVQTQTKKSSFLIFKIFRIQTKELLLLTYLFYFILS